MPIDPNNLAAFAAGTGGPPPGADEGGGEIPDEEAPVEEEGPGKFGMLLTLLEQHAEDVEGLTDEFDPAELVDETVELDEPDIQALWDGFDGLDEALQTEIRASLPGVTLDEARDLASHLEAEGIIQDAERVAGWLFRVGKLDLAAEGENDDDEEDLEEEPADEALDEIEEDDGEV
jgi:hypothetical protein